MEPSRRTALRLGLSGSAGLIASMLPSPLRAQGIVTEGVNPSSQAVQNTATSILNGLPTNDYVLIMEALANLGKTAPLGPDGLPYNQRWPIHANPLLVQMWHDLGYIKVANDCLSWCGVAIGWSLKRTGRAIPGEKGLPGVAVSSQSYLQYGRPVFTPQPGDLAVFTDYSDKNYGHVTIFRRWIDSTTIEVLGGNQGYSSKTNCPSGFHVTMIDETSMAIDSRKVSLSGAVSGKYLNQFIRPPAPTAMPVVPTGPAIF